jgi:hypothetical protein
LPNSRLFLDLDLVSCIVVALPLRFLFFLLLAITLLSHPGQRKCRREIEIGRGIKSKQSSSTCRQALSYVISTLPVDLSGSVNPYSIRPLTAGVSSTTWLTWRRPIKSVDHGLINVILLYQVAQTHNRCVSSLRLLSLSGGGGRTT